MGSIRLPGPLCTILAKINIDTGTLCRQASNVSAPVGYPSRKSVIPDKAVAKLDSQEDPKVDKALTFEQAHWLTWDSEGAEGGPFHSRRLTVPSKESGLTIGRGYDMKDRTQAQILGELIAAGVAKTDAEMLSKASKLKGPAAEKFVKDGKLENFEISMPSQQKLFELTFTQKAEYAKRLCTKADVSAKYGACNWDSLDFAIREVLIDMTFRGDYDANARAKLQRFVAKNDLASFFKVMSDKSEWANVPKDRFDRRVKFLSDVIATRK